MASSLRVPATGAFAELLASPSQLLDVIALEVSVAAAA